MKYWKKIIAFIAVISLAVTALPGCKSPAEPSAVETTPAPASEQTTPEPTDGSKASDPTLPSVTDAPVPGEKVDYAAMVTLDLQSETAKQEVTVHLFIDGDTTHFNVPEEIEESGILKARYLGVNTPESTGVIEKWGKQASMFTKEKLSGADSIYVESDDENWNFDNTTSHRCLCWVWYRTKGESSYRNLNIELLQEGLAIANNSAQNRYGETAMEAINQAKTLKLHYYSDEDDPMFYEGSIREVTLKALRTTPDYFLNTTVSFEAQVAREYSNTLYVQEYDEEDGIFYGITVYLGYSADPDLLGFTKIGNRVRFVGSLQYYEAGGTYQVSGIQYKPRKPQESCQLLEEGERPKGTVIDPAEFNHGKRSVIVTRKLSDDEEGLEVEEEYPVAQLIMSTAVTLQNLSVESIYTTTSDSSSSKGAMTLTCKAPDGAYVDIRTVVLYDENNELVTASAYQGKTIDVTGVVDYYSGSYQIKVFTTDDIVVH